MPQLDPCTLIPQLLIGLIAFFLFYFFFLNSFLKIFSKCLKIRLKLTSFLNHSINLNHVNSTITQNNLYSKHFL